MSRIVQIHRHASGAGGIFANAYLIETANAVVAVDSLLTETDSKALRAAVEALHKPLLAVLVTHGHPDHYNGVTNLVGVDRVPVVATAGVDRVIRENDAAKERQWRPVFGDEWPKRRIFPNRIARDGEAIVFDDLSFTVHDLGPGESHSDSIWIADDPTRPASIGDVVINHMHACTADGHTAEWLENLRRVRALVAGACELHPGHGEPGSTDLLDWQAKYLRALRREVASLSGGRTSLTDEEKGILVRRMKEELPNDRLEFLIALGADAVASEVAPTV